VNIQPKLQNVFRDVFDDDTIVIHDETTAKDIPDWDSLMHVTLMVAIERAFGIRFDAAEVTGLPNVGALAQVVERKVGRA
jgi:acyl carrier protein